MKIANVPKKMAVVFGVNGQRQDLLDDAVSGKPNASYNAGFPPVTMIAKSAGGQAPLGKDFNQIFNELSADAQWSQASGIYPYDSDFSKAIGGYPKGALVLGADGITIYQNTIDDNISDISNNSWINIAGDISKLVTVNNLGSENGFSLVGQVDSFASLRLLKPTKEGQRVILSSWNGDVHPYGQSSFGGGEFISVSGSSTDDGGFIAKYSNSWYWQRIKSADQATILDFGAIPDGTTLVDDALKRMFLWAYGDTEQSNGVDLWQTVAANKGLIRFGSGTFAIGNVDLSTYGIRNGVQIYGESDSEYKNIKTTIYTKSTSGYAISGKFLQCEISGFNIIGNYASNTSDECGFFDNVYAGAPQQFRSNSIHVQYLGGVLFNLVDTMDTELTQIYMEHGSSTLIYAKWSGNVYGGWDHTTAISLRNISVWNVKKNSVLFLPRCMQGQIDNVWISSCDKPGNISQGEWKLSGPLQLEYNLEDFKADITHLVGFQPGTQGDYGITYTNGSDEIPASWDDNSMGVPSYVTDPSWEKGQTLFFTTGIDVSYGSISSCYYNSMSRMDNYTSTASWYHVGRVYLPNLGESCEIIIRGCGAYNSTDSELTQGYDTSFGTGKCVIGVQYKDSGKNQASWYGEGSSPVQDVITSGSGQYIDIYAQIRGYTRSTSVFINTDSVNRLNSGLHFKFDFYGTVVDDITTISPQSKTPSKWMVGNAQSNGALGVDMTNGSLLIGANLKDLTSTNVSSKGIPVYISGELYYIPLISE